MDEQLLQKAITGNTKILKPVIDASYSFRQISTIELIEIAISVNKTLGFELFNDLYGPRLKTEFSLVTRAVSNNAIPRRKSE